jgi:hypothetical protein
MPELDFGERKFNREDRGELMKVAYVAWAIGALIPILIIVFVCTRFNPFPVELALASIVAGAIFFIPGYSFSRVANSYLVTSPEGVEYHLRGRVATARWAEVARIAMVPLNERQPERVSGEGLIIRSLERPSAPLRVREEEGKFLWYIPLQPFGWHWRETDLGRAIAEYAPHLMSAQQEEQPSSSTYMQEQP